MEEKDFLFIIFIILVFKFFDVVYFCKILMMSRYRMMFWGFVCFLIGDLIGGCFVKICLCMEIVVIVMFNLDFVVLVECVMRLFVFGGGRSEVCSFGEIFFILCVKLNCFWLLYKLSVFIFWWIDCMMWFCYFVLF